MAHGECLSHRLCKDCDWRFKFPQATKHQTSSYGFITGSWRVHTMWLLWDYYVISMWFTTHAYPFGIDSVTLLSGNGVVSGITSMIYTLSCILYVLSENTFSVSSKSSQESIFTSFLPENQYTIFITQYVGFVVIVGLKPSKPTFPTHVVFVCRVHKTISAGISARA